MSESAVEPVGFCPSCGYRVDPGVCPECGGAVSDSNIVLQSERDARQRRRWRIALYSIISLGLAGGGFAVYRAVDWVPYLPTSMLLARQNDPSGRFFNELWSRHKGGLLAKADADRMFDQLVAWPKTLGLLDPYPERQTMVARVTAFASPSSTGLLVEMRDPELIIDGKRPPGRSVQFNGYSSMKNKGIWTIFEAPSAGEHSIELEYAATILSPATSAVCYSVHKRIVQKLVTDGRPLSEHVTLVWDKQLAQQLAGRTLFEVGRERGDVKFKLWFTMPGTEVCGKFIFAPAGELEKDVPEGHRLDIVVDPGSRSCHSTGPLDVGDSDAARFDGQFVPDRLLALQHGQRRLFGGKMEWRGVRVKDKVSTGFTPGGDPPTRVAEWRDSRR